MLRKAQDEMPQRAMRICAEFKLSWKEMVRVVVININTVIGCSKRYSMEGESGLKFLIAGLKCDGVTALI
jgi:hypothetical protein